MRAQRIILSTAALSGVFAVGLWAAWAHYDSELAQAQAADSLVDFAGAFILSWVVRVAERPSDDDHPLGHGRAEPLGALGVAMLAAMLALRVGQGAIEALWSGDQVRPDSLLLEIFIAKVLFKGGVMALSRRSGSPALRALAVDARNDILVGLTSVAGYVGILLGYASLDAMLALPVAVWIGWSGWDLARENIGLLMGEAPSQVRQDELVSLAGSVAGVIEAHALRAHHVGVQFSINIHVSVDHDLTLKEAHDIGERVRRVLEAEEDVHDCSVHIDPLEPRSRTGHQRAPREGAAGSKSGTSVSSV